MKKKCPECENKLVERRSGFQFTMYCNGCNKFFSINYIIGYWKGYKAGRKK